MPHLSQGMTLCHYVCHNYNGIVYQQIFGMVSVVVGNIVGTHRGTGSEDVTGVYSVLEGIYR